MNEQHQNIDLPQVTGVEHGAAGSVTLTLQVDAELNVFDGHFDEAPVVPGVVQLHWALALCGDYLRPIDPRTISHIDALKFQQIIQPGTQPILQLTLSEQRLEFRFDSPQGALSSGKVVLI